MAGHSKWANIKHRKAAQDAKKGKVFTRLIRELTMCARKGGGDPQANPALRTAVQTALSHNMTKDTIQKAISRGVGGEGDADLMETRYEGYGAGGVAVIVETLTNNKNRTVGEVRHAFTKHGGNLGTDGSVAYLFAKKGILSYAPGTDEDGLLTAALDAGADDVVTHSDGSMDVLTKPETFSDVVDAMNKTAFKAENAEITQLSSVSVDLDLETAQRVIKMIDMLEDLDDVQNVYSNANFPAEAFND